MQPPGLLVARPVGGRGEGHRMGGWTETEKFAQRWEELQLISRVVVGSPYDEANQVVALGYGRAGNGQGLRRVLPQSPQGGDQLVLEGDTCRLTTVALGFSNPSGDPVATVSSSSLTTASGCPGDRSLPSFQYPQLKRFSTPFRFLIGVFSWPNAGEGETLEGNSGGTLRAFPRLQFNANSGAPATPRPRAIHASLLHSSPENLTPPFTA